MLVTAHTGPRYFHPSKGSHLRISGGVLDPNVYHSGRMGTKKGTVRPEREIYHWKVGKLKITLMKTQNS